MHAALDLVGKPEAPCKNGMSTYWYMDFCLFFYRINVGKYTSPMDGMG